MTKWIYCSRVFVQPYLYNIINGKNTRQVGYWRLAEKRITDQTAKLGEQAS